MIEKDEIADIIHNYEETTGKKWTINEQHMVEICDTFDYTFMFNEKGNIGINMKGISETYNGQSIYEFFGKNFCDKEKFIDHREYVNVQAMIDDWTEECKKLNSEYLSKHNHKAFSWI